MLIVNNMGNSEEFKERALRKVRSKESIDDTRRKRRLSKLFLVIDAVIILMVMLYFYNGSEPQEAYYTTKINYHKMEYRFSVATVKKSNNYLFSLSIKSNRERVSEIKFNNSIATIDISRKDQKVFEKKLGNGINRLKMYPAEIRSFAENIDFKIMDDYINENSDLLQIKKKSLINFRSREVKFTAKIKLNTVEKIVATVDFKHGVK